MAEIQSTSHFERVLKVSVVLLCPSFEGLLKGVRPSGLVKGFLASIVLIVIVKYGGIGASGRCVAFPDEFTVSDSPCTYVVAVIDEN